MLYLIFSYMFLVLSDHGVYMYVVYSWKWSSAHALGGVSGVTSFIIFFKFYPVAKSQ